MIRLSLPAYVQTVTGDRPTVIARPLFSAEPVERAATARRALARLQHTVRKHLQALGEAARHDELMAFCWSPPCDDRLLEVTLELGKRRVRTRLLAAVVARRWCAIPAVSDFWLEIDPEQSVRDQVEVGVSRFLREEAKASDDPHGVLEAAAAELSRLGKAWVMRLEVTVDPPTEARLTPESQLLALSGGAPAVGAMELQKVGRCLDWLYPDDLDRCVGRPREVERLVTLLEAPDRRPVLLVGERLAGKTCVVHEATFQRLKRAGKPTERGAWLLSPQRLISGMSFVGQWEDRVLSILRTAAERDHILYFDDLPGLLRAGITREARLSVADLLKPAMERREVRVLGEITPHALAILREKDRAFADAFEILPVGEMDADQTLRTCLQVVRDAEMRHACAFAPATIPTVVELQRRYARDAAFPGKAAQFLRHLAARHPSRDVGREEVLQAFEERSGLALAVLDDRRPLERRDVLGGLSARVVGQRAALEAMADVVGIAKARLQDPDRPLASLLFVGPSGVGKTQCAKALAAWLFGSEDRLVRFDMNEYVTPDAVARLVGTYRNPDGLLVAAVRRNPFCVLLLDEIEKAHPDAFNLLLQVMGDARLQDALGRTVSLGNAIIVLTSNLGGGEAARPVGLRSRDGQLEQVYRAAAERFFSPEFFNRLDRVVPFDRLSRAEVATLARGLLDGLLVREGLVRRRCMLTVAPAAMDALVDEAADPTLGARALKRVVERRIGGPVAERLAAMAGDAPAVVTVDAGLRVSVTPLRPAARRAVSGPASVEEMERALATQEREIEKLSPPGAVTHEDLSGEALRYFAAGDVLRRARAMLGRLRAMKRGPVQARRHAPARVAMLARLPEDVVDSPSALRRLSESVQREMSEPALLAGDLHREVALLGLILAGGEEAERTLRVRALQASGDGAARDLLSTYREALRDAEVEPAGEDTLRVRGALADVLLAGESGIHLVRAGDGLIPLEVSVDGAVHGHVARLYDRGTAVDFALGAVAPTMGWPELRALMLMGCG